MNVPMLEPMLIFAVGVGAAGVYLLLPQADRFAHREWRWAGGLLAGLALLIIGGTYGVRFSASGPAGDWMQRGTLVLSGGAGVVAAVGVVSSRSGAASVRWFLLMTLANAVLCVAAGAWYVGLAILLISAGGSIVALLFLARLVRMRRGGEGLQSCEEPLLATTMGALLAISLVSVIHFSRAVEGPMADGAGPALPRRTAITAALQQTSADVEIRRDVGHVAGIGQALTSEFGVVLVVVGLLMLVATVGAVSVVRRRDEIDVGRSGPVKSG